MEQTKCERALALQSQGYNCAQAVVAAFAEDLSLPEEQLVSMSSGFGAGAGTGELCGAIVGGVMVLGLTHPVDATDPVGSKQRTSALGKDFQQRFRAQFNHLRCADLLRADHGGWMEHPLVQQYPIKRHCQLMVAVAVDLVEEILKEA